MDIEILELLKSMDKKINDLTNDVALLKTELIKAKKTKPKNNNVKAAEKKYLSDKEFKSVVSVLKEDKSRYADRNRAIISVAYDAGLRASEVCNLKLNDIDFKSGTVNCRRLKGSSTNKVKLRSHTIELIKKLNPTDGILFKSRKSNGKMTRQAITNIAKDYFEYAGVDKCRCKFHTIKHTTAVRLADQGLNISEVQRIIGHKSVKTTELYMDFTEAQMNKLNDKLNR